MIVFGLLLGIATAELITRYWNSRYKSIKVYAYDRRIHHGEIGALLLLSSLFLRVNPAANIAAILTGIGITLIKDDRADIEEWFKIELEQEQPKGELELMQKQIRNMIDIQEEEIELEINRSQSLIA